MKDELKYNLHNYLKLDAKKHMIAGIIIFLSLITFLIISYNFEFYDVEQINATTICEEDNCSLMFYHYGTINSKYNFVKIKNEKYLIDNITFLEPQVDYTNNIFQNLNLKLREFNGENNEIVELKIYKNKEKIIKKIFKLIVER